MRVGEREVLPAVDPAVAGGGALTASVETIAGVELDAEGWLTIAFESDPQASEPPMINGIEVLGREPLTEDFA
ncbi:MAG: hypothetical protein ACOCXJ_07360, partial [Planctomycetota bacterium]